MPRWEFVRYASRLGMAFFDMTKGEWEAEVQQSETLWSQARLSRTHGISWRHKPLL
jgi:hypothetical protein